MKKLLTFILVSFLVITTSHAQSRDEKKLGESVEALRKAMLDADKSALEALTLPALSYGHSSGKIEDQSTFIQSLVSGSSDFVTMDLTQQSIIVQGKTAIVRHILSGETKDNGRSGTVKLGVMLVWQKNHGKWKLLARQAFKV